MATAQIYSLDTSFFMDWQARFYPVDVFRSLEERIETLIEDERGLAVALVREEIEAVGTPELRAWAKKHRRLFVPMSSEIQKAGAAIEAGIRTCLTRRVHINLRMRTSSRWPKSKAGSWCLRR